MSSKLTQETLKTAIEGAINNEIDRVTQELIVEAQTKMAARIPEIVAGISLRVHKMFSVQHMRDEMVIHVKLEEK